MVYKRIKQKIKRIIGDDGASGPSAVANERARISGIVADDLNLLLPTHLTSSPESALANKKSGAPFEDFFRKFVALRKGGESHQGTLEELRRAYPLLFSTCDGTLKYLEACEAIDSPLANGFKRLCVHNLPVVQAPPSRQMLEYKSSLPRVGLLYYPNPEPRRFLIDALEGDFYPEDIDPGQTLQQMWTHKDCDFATYQEIFRQRVEDAFNQFPEWLISSFPDRDRAIDVYAQHLQFQMAFTEMLKQNYWDLVFLGAFETPMGLAYYDYPKEKRPKTILFYHGLIHGDPVDNLFCNPDVVLVRGKAEASYFQNLGFAEEKIVKVGSLAIERFPSEKSIELQRQFARSRYDLGDQEKVILWALTYDLFLYDKQTPEQLLELVLGTIAKVAIEGNLNPLTLLLKYHPAPRDNEYYSFSRQQFPLDKITSRLGPLGVSVRLVHDIASCIPAADLFLAHESTALVEALDAAVPTLSLRYNKSQSPPLLGNVTYQTKRCHQIIDDHCSVDELYAVMFEQLSYSREDIIKQSADVWNGLYDCGRTEGLGRVSKLVKSLVMAK